MGKKKLICRGQEAREHLLEGFRQVFESVAATAGPKGRWVAIQLPSVFHTKLTKDGVSVAKSIELSDVFANEGAKILKRSAQVQLEEAGDGTTANVILTYAIAKEGMKDVSAGANPQDLKKGIEKAVAKCCEFVKEHSKPVSSQEEVTQVTTLSANSDTELGSIVAEAIESAGENGCIEVEDSPNDKSYVESVMGYRLDKGIDSPYFLTDAKRLVAEYDQPAIVVIEGTASNITAMCGMLDEFREQNKAVVILAEKFDDGILPILISNRAAIGLKVIPIQVSQYQKKNLLDIATLTGATLITEEMGMTIEGWQPEYAGYCAKVRANKDYITFIGMPESQKEAIEKHVESLKEEIRVEKENDDNAYEIVKMKKRLGYLTDGVHIIRVGGMNPTEVAEKKDRIDDALRAGMCSREEGIVPGGGTIFLRMLSEKILDTVECANRDQYRGVEIVKRALTYPTSIILNNAGDRADWVIGMLIDGEYNKDFNVGYDAQESKFKDMYEAGIIDPAKVSRIAMQSASKSATDLLITEVLIVDDPDDVPKVAPQPMAPQMAM